MELCLAINLTDKNKKDIEKETSHLFDDYKEFLWYEPNEYILPIYSWSNVEVDLVEKLSTKIKDSLFDNNTFELFSIKYVVKISSRIEIFLVFQREAKYTRLVRTIEDEFSQVGIPTPDDEARLAIARYKIPSRQQYTHLKNKLEKIETDIHVAVDRVSLFKVTQFGNGAKENVRLCDFGLQGSNFVD